MAYEIDVSRGECRGDLSRQWATRPADERFLNLGDLHAQTKLWAEQSRNIEAVPAHFDVDVVDDDLAVHLDGAALGLNHYSLGQMAQLAGVPAGYLRDERVPPELAALCLVNGLGKADQRPLAAYIREDGQGNGGLRAITSPRYGRIYDHEVAASLMTIAGDGTGDARWKIPGCIGWGGGGGVTYDSETPVTLETTTLFASDRNMFCFLCDDRNPVEVGKLASGEPDLMFRGLMAWNSEVMERTYGLAGFWLRGVCGNRNLWGVEDFQQIVIRHTGGGPGRFAEEVAPYLEAYAEGGVADVAARVKAAKALTFGDPEGDKQIDFLVSKMGFNRKQALAITRTSPDGDGEADHAPEDIWQLANAATAWSRTIEHQDARLDAEARIGKVMDTVD